MRHVDLLPTVLDVLGLPVPGDVTGRSLLPLLARRDDGPSRPSYFEALSASLNRGWAPLHGLREGRLKYIDLPLPEQGPQQRHEGRARRRHLAVVGLVAEARGEGLGRWYGKCGS